MDGDDRRRIIMLFLKACAVCVIGAAYVYNVNRQRRSINNCLIVPNHEKKLHRNGHMLRILYGSNKSSIEYLRMHRDAFLRLSYMLRERNLLQDTMYVSIEEQVAMFLHIVGHSSKNRVVKLNFVRSGWTVSKYFNEVMQVICALRDEYVKQPSSAITPTKIASNPKWYSYFKDCVGFIDGTHIDARVPAELVARFRGRKGVTQNVLVACDCNIKITYVLAGWEGAANDMGVLRDALSRPDPDRLRVPEGKFYLVDAGYTTISRFIAPYQKIRYHLREYSGCRPTNAKELFNLRHSSLRSKIERFFGLLKNRFKILSFPPFYPLQTQVDVVLACSVLHNYILEVDQNDDLLQAEISPDEENIFAQIRLRIEAS